MQLGVASTRPDPSMQPNDLVAFDPSPSPLNPDDFVLYKAAPVLGNLLLEAIGACSGICKVNLLL